MPDNFWLLFVANLPFLVGLFWALQKGIIVMGVTHNQIVSDKNEDLVFREKLRQEALQDNAALEKSNREISTAMGELTTVITQTLTLNDRLLSETLGQRWDEKNDRRTPKNSTRT